MTCRQRTGPPALIRFLKRFKLQHEIWNDDISWIEILKFKQFLIQTSIGILALLISIFIFYWNNRSASGPPSSTIVSSGEQREQRTSPRGESGLGGTNRQNDQLRDQNLRGQEPNRENKNNITQPLQANSIESNDRVNKFVLSYKKHLEDQSWESIDRLLSAAALLTPSDRNLKYPYELTEGLRLVPTLRAEVDASDRRWTSIRQIVQRARVFGQDPADYWKPLNDLHESLTDRDKSFATPDQQILLTEMRALLAKATPRRRGTFP